MTSLARPAAARGLDHVVHAVRDLDAAGDFYRRLGFTVGVRNRHPWGTHNRLVQLPGFFVELLTVAEPEKLGSDVFSRLFGERNRDFLARGEGLSLLILESHDAGADAAAFSKAQIAASGPQRFEREGKRPDGAPVKVAFTLAFARDDKAPEIGFAVCQQHYPENFWNPTFQTHANGVNAIAGAVAVAENPTDHHIFMSAFCGQRELLSSSSGITLTTPRGAIKVMDPAAFRVHFGVEAPAADNGARLAALRFASADLARTASVLQREGVKATAHQGRLVVGPESARGATLVFEQV